MNFQPNALPTLIGSLPLNDHVEAVELILKYTPEIPLWPQLPVYEHERLLTQFIEGLPGIKKEGDKIYFDTSSSDFDQQMLSFFEDYLAITEAGAALEGSRFAFSKETSKGFKTFLDMVSQNTENLVALKGQITGPFTMLTGIKDQDEKLSFFNPVLRDATVKAISLKARYQVEEMKKSFSKVILFLDEPALSGFGSSAMVGITREDTINDLTSVIKEVKKAGALCGIHVCANTDWSLVLECGIDILSFDAYGFFDKVILYKDALKNFLEKGGIIAWGLVPTLNPEDLEKEDIDSLFKLWQKDIKELELDEKLIKKQALITPSCGTGLLKKEQAERALMLTNRLSKRIRNS